MMTGVFHLRVAALRLVLPHHALILLAVECICLKGCGG